MNLYVVPPHEIEAKCGKVDLRFACSLLPPLLLQSLHKAEKLDEKRAIDAPALHVVDILITKDFHYFYRAAYVLRKFYTILNPKGLQIFIYNIVQLKPMLL